MTSRRGLKIVPLLLICLATVPVLGQDLKRGAANYVDVLMGIKKLEQLSPAERAEVRIVQQRYRAERINEGKGPNCRESKVGAAAAADELASLSARLQRCAASLDLADDCSSEFRRVRGAHDDYEQSIARVAADCS